LLSAKVILGMFMLPCSKPTAVSASLTLPRLAAGPTAFRALCQPQPSASRAFPQFVGEVLRRPCLRCCGGMDWAGRPSPPLEEGIPSAGKQALQLSSRWRPLTPRLQVGAGSPGWRPGRIAGLRLPASNAPAVRGEHHVASLLCCRPPNVRRAFAHQVIEGRRPEELAPGYRDPPGLRPLGSSGNKAWWRRSGQVFGCPNCMLEATWVSCRGVPINSACDQQVERPIARQPTGPSRTLAKRLQSASTPPARVRLQQAHHGPPPPCGGRQAHTVAPWPARARRVQTRAPLLLL